ncbi:MAG: hypothetical protein JWL63_3091 [Rhodocyclales bacterium]|nr:hypothetical protein [Rhodocyclales bacterium]
MKIADQFLSRFPRLHKAMQTPRVLRLLRVVVIAVATIGVLGFFAAPPLVRYVAEKQGTQALGRQLSIERVRINPFALSVAVEGLRIADAQGSGSFVSVGRAAANVELFASIYRRGVVFSALRIERPDIRLARLADNRFNFSDIIDRLNARPKPKEPGEPLHFALNNIELRDGHIEFDDQPAGQHHVVDKLAIGLPFISDIPSQVQLLVQPRLDAHINGTEFSLKGRIKPFADHREATLDLSFEPFELTRYLGYVPGKLPVSITQALLSSNLECVWAEQGKAGQTLALRGDVTLSDVRLKDAQGADLMSWRRLQIGMQDVQPLASPMKLSFGNILFVEPQLAVQRLRDGSLNLQHLAGGSAEQREPAIQNKSPAPKKTDAPAPLITIAGLAIQRGTLRWKDAALSEPFETQLSSIDANLQGFDSSGKRAANLKASLQAESSGTLSATGQVNTASGAVDMRLELSKLRLERYRPYYAKALGAARPSAEVAAAVQLLIAPEKHDGPQDGGLRLSQGSLQLTGLLLPDTAGRGSRAGNKRPLLQLASLSVADFSLDAAARKVVLGQITSRDAQWRVMRDANGIDLLRAFGIGDEPVTVPAADAGNVAAAASDALAAAPDKSLPWTIVTGTTDLSGWSAAVEDRTGREPVSVSIDRLALRTSGLSTEKGSTGHVELGFGVNRRGQVRLAGDVGLTPMKGSFKLDARTVDLLFAQPYVSNFARVLITQGALDARGRVGFDLSDSKLPQFSWSGDAALKDFNSFDEINETDFVRWKKFSVAKLDLHTQPLAVSVGEVRLEDFYTRLILDAQGRFNLRGLVQTGAAPADAASAPAVSIAGKSVATLPPPKPMKLKVDQITLLGGNVSFSDRFVKPNYDANLTEVAGSLKGLSSDSTTVADLSLKAFVDHSAPVEVSGQLNPLRQDRILDIAAHVSDIDLTGVSTYATRYVGYGITKGKLSMEVKYQIRDRKLTAENRVTLDQLTFGEHIDSPTATRLPVLLAVALLKDRNGVIDLNLPVSGTLDDPEFSVGGVVLRVLVNLVTKAVTAPFSLLGSMFGGGEELSYIDFDGGAAALPASAQGKLTALARALTERPALRLEIAGAADPVRDLPGLKRTQLDSKLRALKAATMVKRGESFGGVDSLVISAEEYPLLLEQVYKAEKMDKPRNALGIAKDLPVPEMEKLLLAASPVSDADLRVLADRRAQTVREWLVGAGKVPTARVFVVEHGAVPASEAHARVDFALR